MGCLYKILSKVLANRLRMIIGRVISETHTTFVKDRKILDGILIANEVVDEAKKSKKELMLGWGNAKNGVSGVVEEMDQRMCEHSNCIHSCKQKSY